LNWVLRYSLLATLSVKFKSSLKKIVANYSMAPKVEYIYFNIKSGKNFSKILASYPTKIFFNEKKKIFNPKVFFPIEFLDLSKVKSPAINVV